MNNATRSPRGSPHSQLDCITRAGVLVAMLLVPSLARAEPKLTASCAPALVTRGETVRCTAAVQPPPPYYTLLSRSALAAGHLRTETLHELRAGTQRPSWEGPGVVATEVTFTARVGNSVQQASAQFEVRPRQFPRALLDDSAVQCAVDAQAAELADPPPLASDSTRDEPVPTARALSHATLTATAPDFQLVDRGPDTFWYFVRAPAAHPLALRILLSRALEPGDAFFQQQHGDRSLLLRKSGQSDWPHCFQFDAAELRRQLWESEGCKGDSKSSRVERLRAALAGPLDINQALEEMALPLDDANARENPFVRALEEKMKSLSDALFESSRPPPVRIACRLRY